MPKSRIDVYTDLHRSPEKLNQTSTALNGMRNHAVKSGNALKGLWKQVAIGMGVVVGIPAMIKAVKGLGKSFLDVAVETEQYELRLKALLGSQKKATEAMAFFEEVASKVPFTLEQVIEAGTTVTAFGADLKKWTPILTDLAAVMGIDLVEAAAALGRAYAGGAGAADIFRERGILQIIKDFARMKYRIDDITKLSLPRFREVMFEAFVDSEGKIAGAADDLATTWTGIISMIQDKWFKFRKWVMETEIFGLLKDQLKSFDEKLDEFIATGKLEQWAKDTAVAILEAFKFIVQGFQNVMVGFYTLKAALIDSTSQVIEFLIGWSEFVLKINEVTKHLGGPFKKEHEDLIKRIEFLKAVQEGLNEEYDIQIDNISEIIEKFSPWIKKLNEAKGRVKELSTEEKKLSDETENLGEKIEQADRSWITMDLILKNLPRRFKESAVYASGFNKAMKEQMETLQMWAIAAMGGIAGLLGMIKQMIAYQLMLELTKAKMPFLAKLALLIPTIMALQAAFSALETMFTSKKGYAEGAYFKKRSFISGEVAEREPEFLAPESKLKTVFKETIRETKTLSSQINFNFYAPLVSTTGGINAEQLFDAMEREAHRRGYKLVG